MSERPSRLDEADRLLVLDASAVINLLGTSHAASLLRALARTCVVEQTAWREILRDPLTGKSAAEPLKALVDARLLARQQLAAEAVPVFLDLALAPPPDGLDDGESATAAHAAHIGATAVIDERKAIRICREKLPKLRVVSTLDLLSHHLVAQSLGRSTLAEAVYSALKKSRMRVPVEFHRWVLQLIGKDRASDCPSLGRLRE